MGDHVRTWVEASKPTQRLRSIEVAWLLPSMVLQVALTRSLKAGVLAGLAEATLTSRHVARKFPFAAAAAGRAARPPRLSSIIQISMMDVELDCGNRLGSLGPLCLSEVVDTSGTLGMSPENNECSCLGLDRPQVVKLGEGRVEYGLGR